MVRYSIMVIMVDARFPVSNINSLVQYHDLMYCIELGFLTEGARSLQLGVRSDKYAIVRHQHARYAG